jgi:hypothetical protein
MDELDDFDGATTTFGVESMPDGELTATMVRGGTRIDKWAGNDSNPGGSIIGIKYEVVTPAAPKGQEGNPDHKGQVFQFKHWLNREEARQQLMDELKRVGFQVDEWGDKTSEYPRTRMVPLALKYLRLEGVELKLAKKTKQGNTKKFVSLYMNGKVAGNDPIPSAAVLACKDVPETAEETF